MTGDRARCGLDYAPAGTLPGLLQRGRGLGARMAAEDPSAAAGLVYGCVRWDWRWDGQADSRHLYLARLIRDLGLSPEPVTALLTADRDTCERATRVLELLALGGSAQAREALREHVREGGHGLGPQAPPRGDHRPDPGPDLDPGVPALVAELERCWVERQWCGPDGTALGLARFGAGAGGAVSLLRRFWLWTPHSYERTAYLEALAAIGPAGLADAYAECLWDCEESARLLGVERAPDGPVVRERLAYLRDDPMEEAAVRAAARVRLAVFAGG
ncbi:hypothetical protein [Kitasatospora sp. NPDC088351]|uniref:hypothetical protein n=1 Tax=unclassified Kitasatospora TaxID=2633591 RepID=UPI00342D9E7E